MMINQFFKGGRRGIWENGQDRGNLHAGSASTAGAVNACIEYFGMTYAECVLDSHLEELYILYRYLAKPNC